jgi:hypothetical protein
MFRPEMLRPMGLPPGVRVIAWGLSLVSRISSHPLPQQPQHQCVPSGRRLHIASHSLSYVFINILPPRSFNPIPVISYHNTVYLDLTASLRHSLRHSSQLMSVKSPFEIYESHLN